MAESRDPYNAIAEWYDVEHDPLFEDVECYLSLLALPRTGHVRVLEIGCGTGRIAALLAVAGHSVTGIEPSRAMRERCETRLSGLPDRVRRRVRVIAGNAADLALPSSERFDMALYGLNTLAHLVTVEERAAALRSAAAHLQPTGQLLLDVDLFGPRKLAESPGQLWFQGQWQLPGSASQLTHMIAASPSDLPGAIEVHHFYDLFEQGGQLRRTSANMTLAVLSYGDVIGGLTNAGFNVEALYGGHDLPPFQNDSPRLIVDARMRPA
jgi:SAM-dependent methyltransferase